MPQRCGRSSSKPRPTLNATPSHIALCLFMLVLSHFSSTAKAFVLRTPSASSSSVSAFSRRLRPAQQHLRMASSSAPSSSSSSSSSSKGGAFPYRLTDSHHHVWTAGEAPYPYAKGQSAPPGLQERG